MKIMLRIFILILLPINIYADVFLGHVYKDTWHSAKVRCKGGLLTPTNLTERSVVDLMKQEKFRTMWIDVTRQQFHNLQWPDGSANTMPVEEDLSFTSPYKCGYVNTKSQKQSVSVTGCEESKPGFICQFVDIEKCHQDFTIFNGSCYQFMYGHQMYNWQVAYQQCRSRGGSLATLNSQSLIQYISDKAVRYHGYSLEWWIGLSQAQYVDKFGNVPDLQRWYIDQPKWKKKCVFMTKKDGRWFWKTSRCDREHPFICSDALRDKTAVKIDDGTVQIEVFNATGSGSSTTTERSKSHVGAPTWKFIFIAVVPVLLTFLLFCGVRKLYQICKEKKIMFRETKESNEHNTLMDSSRDQPTDENSRALMKRP